MKKFLLLYLFISSLTLGQINHFYGVTKIDSLVLTSGTLITDVAIAAAIAAAPVNASTQAALNLKLNEDFVNTYVYDGSPATTDYIAVQKAGSESIRYNTLGEIPTPLETQAKIDEQTNNVQQNYLLKDYGNEKDAEDAVRDSLIAYLLAVVDTLRSSVVTPFPSTPSNLVATGGNYKIDLSWTASTSNHDSTEIWSRLAGTSTFTFLTSVDSGVNVYSHTGMGSNISRDYIVYAKKGTQYSAGSNIATGTTDDLTLALVESGRIHIADAEENNLSEWSYSSISTGNTLTVKDTAKLHGSYGFLTTLDGTASSSYVRYDLPTALDSVRVRLYITLRDTIFLENMYGITFLRFAYNGTNTTNAYLSFNSLTDSSYVSDLKWGNTSIKPTGWNPTDTVCVEMYYKKGTGTNAIYQVYADGVLKVNRNNLSDVSQVNQILVGGTALGSRVGSSGAWFKFDDVIINDTSYISLYNATGAGSGGTIVATRWFVDKNATGTGTGRTIENAWTSFANIGWSSMATGDTLFISGGIDSTVYNETLAIGKGGITIMCMVTTGHNGKVIIDGESIRDYGILNQSSYSNVLINGIDKTKFIIRRFVNQGIRFRYNSNNTIKNFTVELNEPTAFSGVFLFGGEWQSPPTFAGPYTVENFSILQDSGSYAGSGNSDGIQVGGVDGVTIRNGYIRLWNADPNPHSDDIQLYHSKNILIERNQIYHYNAGATSNKQGIYITGSGGDVKIRNNYISLASESFGSAIAFEVYDNTWWTVYAIPDSIEITNNTVVCDYDAPNAIRLVQAISNTDFSANTILKNNIFIKGNFAIDRKYFTSGSNCDYNNYYNGASAVDIWDATSTSTGSGRTWAVWQSYGFDVHSYTTNPLLTGYIPSTSGDADSNGTNLSTLGYTTSLLGTTRTGSWWIGAYQP